MGIFDRSSSSNVTNLTDATTTNTTQTDQSGGSLNFSDIAGAVGLEFNENLSSYESTTNVQTDQGAVGAGLELGLAGIGAARDSAATLANSYGGALTVLERVNADSLELLAGLASDSIDASQTLARDGAESNANFLQQAVSGFGSLAKQTSESGDDKIARVVGFALAAVAAVVVLPAIFSGGSKGVLA